MSWPTGNVVKLSHRNVAKLGGCLGCQATGNVVHQLSHRNVVKLGGSLAWGEEDWVQMHHQQQRVRKSYKKIGKKK